MNALEKLKRKIRLHGQYLELFTSPGGQEVLQHIMREGFATKSTFVAGDPYATAMNEGSRRLALSILHFVYRDHGDMVKQIEQAAKQEHEN